MQHEWQGSYFDGQTAIRRPATVRLMREGLEVTADGGWTRFWPYREIRQTQGFYAGEEVRLERGGQLPEILLIPDVRFLASLGEVAPDFGGSFHDPGRRPSRLRLTVLAAVAVVAITGALYLWGIPALAAVVAPRVPLAWEEGLGRSVVEYLAPAQKICRDPHRQQLLDSIVARLAAALPADSPYTFQVLVVNEPQVNALAAPGGYIVVFRGLIAQTQSPEELAGVLAHEMEHVVKRHSTKALIQHSATGLLIAALTGDVTGPLAYGLQSARVLGQLQYSRRAESQADAEGMKLLLAARVDPRGLIRFFEEISNRETPRHVREYLSTHPNSGDRIQRLNSLAAQATERPLPLLSGSDWADLKQICTGVR